MKKLSRNTIVLICVGALVWLLLTGLLIFNTLSERWRHSPDVKNSEIIVYENRVSFHEVSKQYALVYTVDGAKPDFLYKPTDNTKIHVRQIKENWYDVAA